MGRGRFHDVVVVGFDDDAARDRARSRARARAARGGETFAARWAGAGHWTLLVLPAAAVILALAAALLQAAPQAPTYDALVARGVAEARAGRTEAARAGARPRDRASTRRGPRPGSSAAACASW